MSVPRLLVWLRSHGAGHQARSKAATIWETPRSFQVTQFKIAEMATRIEAGRNLYLKAAWLLDHGRVQSHLISMAKWYTGETAVKVTEEALQLHGGYGFMGDYNIERFYRDCKIVEIYEGTKEIEKTIIARELLGKY